MSQPPSAWIEAVRRIVTVVGRSDVAEFQLKNGDFRVRLKRLPGALPSVPLPSSDGSVDDSHLHKVIAPLTGIFYRSPSPMAKAYVSEGDWVDADTVIGLVETMKVFNEVTADRAGRVVALLATNGQLVHTGDALITLEPSDRTAAEQEPV